MRTFLTGAALSLSLVACDDGIGVTQEVEGGDGGVVDAAPPDAAAEPTECCHAWVTNNCGGEYYLAGTEGICGEIGDALKAECLNSPGKAEDVETLCQQSSANGDWIDEICDDENPLDAYCDFFASKGRALGFIEECIQELRADEICAQIASQCIGICEQIDNGDFNNNPWSEYRDYLDERYCSQ